MTCPKPYKRLVVGGTVQTIGRGTLQFFLMERAHRDALPCPDSERLLLAVTLRFLGRRLLLLGKP